VAAPCRVNEEEPRTGDGRDRTVRQLRSPVHVYRPIPK
jgi:hypothetical protein